MQQAPSSDQERPDPIPPYSPALSSPYSLTEGGILKKLLLVALPIMGTQFMQMAYNLTDMFWLGRVGSGAVAATGAAGMYLWLSFGFHLIGRMGAEIGVSQYLGRGDKKGALAFSQNSGLIALVLGSAFGLVMILFSRSLISFFNFREEDVASEAAAYLIITGIPMAANFVAGVAAGTFIASGNSRTPFILNGVGLIANVILDPVLILYLGMGVKGAAIATTVSQIVSCSALIIALFVSKGRPFEHYSLRFKPELAKLKMILKWSLPIGLESIFFCFLSMVTSRITASFGANAIAVNRVGAQIESLSWLIGGGFGSALVAFIGQNYGAGKWQRIHRGTRISVGVMILWGSFVTFLLIVLGGAVFSVFLPDPALISLGARYLFILAFAQLPTNLETVAAAAFKGTGRTIPPSLASIVSNLLRPPLAYILAKTSLGLDGIWIAITLTSVMRGLWICLWYLLEGGKRKEEGGVPNPNS